MGHEDRKQVYLIHYIIYRFNFSIGNQCLQHCIQVSTLKSGLLHLTSQPYLKKADQQKSKMVVEAKFLETFSLINTTPDTLETIKGI